MKPYSHFSLLEELKTIIDSLNTFMGKIDSVDEPKQQPKYPEGILEIKAGCVIYKYETSNHLFGSYQEWCKWHLGSTAHTIHSVKNSKGEVFKKGDYAHYVNGSEVKINSFFISNVLDSSLHEIIIAMHSNGSCGIDLLTKAKPKEESLLTEDGYRISEQVVMFQVDLSLMKFCTTSVYEKSDNYKYFAIRDNAEKYVAENKRKPLFTTDDGFDVYDGDCPYYIRLADMFMGQSFRWHEGDVKAADHLFFKEESNAERYVAENKKSISYKELEDYVKNNGFPATPFTNKAKDMAVNRDELLNHFKPK